MAKAVLMLALSASHFSNATEVRRATGRSAPPPPQAELYDNFDGEGGYRAVDGTNLASNGALSPELWHGDGEVIQASGDVADSAAHGNVLRLAIEEPGQVRWKNAYLINPEDTKNFDVGAFSADFLAPANDEIGEFAASLLVWAWLPELEQIDDPYWAANIGFYQPAEGTLQVNWGWWDKADQRHRGGSFEVEYDTWYNLRMDVIQVGESRVMIRFFVDNELVGAGVPTEAEILADPARNGSGPTREINIWRPDGDHAAEVLVDNVHAIFRRLSLNGIEPSSAAQGALVNLIFEGEDFDDDSFPFSPSWGLSFFDITRTDTTKILAKAMVHPNAPVGEQRIAIAAGRSGSSNSLPFEILPGEAAAAVGGRFGLYDDFDGHGGHHPFDDSHLAIDGELSTELWSPYGQVEVVAAADVLASPLDHGNIVELSAPAATREWSALNLVNPSPVPMEMFGSMSVEAIIPASEAAGHRDVSIRYGVWIPDLEQGWNVGVYMSRDADSNVWLSGGWMDLISGEEHWEGFPAEPDRWYELRLDIAAIDDTTMVVSLYVDDVLLLTGIPEQSAILLDPNRITDQTRAIHFWTDTQGAQASAFVDNAHAAYDRLMLTAISPTSGKQGERQRVTITGDGFREGVVPFATEWGVSFVDIVIVDATTIQATALIDEMAPVGAREIIAGVPSSAYSGSHEFNVERNPNVPVRAYAYGIYDDFDGHGGEQRDGSQLAVTGELSNRLWGTSTSRYESRVRAASEILPPDQVGEHGSVLDLELHFSDWYSGRLYMESLMTPSFREFKSWSADFLLRGGASAPKSVIGLDYHSGGIDGGLSWYSITSVEGEEADPSSVRFTARCDNNGRPYVWWDELRPAAFETWYNLRMDFVIVSDTELRIDYFIDGRLWTTESPYEAPIILDGDYDGFRFLESWVGEEYRTGVLHVLVDNVYATYGLN